MEEGVLCALLVFPLLNVVDNQNVDGLVEVDEVVDCVAQYGVGVLHLKQSGADIEHTLLGIDSLSLDTYSINKVCLATS